MTFKVKRLVNKEPQEFSGIHSFYRLPINFNQAGVSVDTCLHDLNNMTFVLLTFNDSLLHLNHESTLVNSEFTMSCKISGFLCDVNKCVACEDNFMKYF